MVTLLIPHEEYTHGSKGFPLKYGGVLTFQSESDNQPVPLSDPIIRAIEAACEGTAEFFEVTITGQGTTLDYYLVGDPLTLLAAAKARDRVM
jgi:hypothetical protein